MRPISTILVFVCGCVPVQAMAGMPHFTLSNVVNMRLSGISFFVAVILLCAAAVKFLWNFLRRDFPRMPRIGYGRSLALVLLVGLLLNIVLLMIAGTRELMTPGAWEKSEISYRLRGETGPAASVPKTEERK